jgi:ligand-binding SRPBCC domain-containing protein
VVVRFTLVTDIAAPAERVFDLSLDVESHVASMGRSRERAIDGRTRGILALGDEVTWRAFHFGLPWTMTIRIVEFERPHRFVDEQVAGPFASFRHLHQFERDGSGTRMTDTVVFDAPFGVLGRAAEGLVLRRRLVELIEARNGYLRQAAMAS